MELEIAVAASKKAKVREQSGCIPYRDKKGERQVLLVKKKSKQAWWGFTKGGLEPHLGKKENAAKECYEEAGITGDVTDKIGRFQYKKDGMNQIVYMYAMEFRVQLDSYPEKKMRRRKWFNLKDAKGKLSKEHHKFLDAIKKMPELKQA